MAPTIPSASQSSSRNSSRVDLTDISQSQQAGRSSTNLHATLSAQSLRQAQRSNASTVASTRHNLLSKRSRPVSTVGSIDEHTPSETSLAPAAGLAPGLQQHAPQAPSSNSRLTRPSSPDGSNRELGSRKDSNDTADVSTRSSGSISRAKGLFPMATTNSGSQASSSIAPPLRPSETSQLGSTTSLTRLPTPRTVRDLGSDYTRYYNPFATHNNSQQDLASTSSPQWTSTTDLLAPGAVSSTDLAQRLHSQFNDGRRPSNPFAASSDNIAPTPPLSKQSSKDKEKEAGVEAGVVGGAAAAAMVEKPGTPLFIRNADPEKTSFYPYLDDRLGAPAYSFPLYTDAKEDDDDMHMPAWDDDIKLKPKFKDHFTRENIVSTFGMLFLLLGLLCVFVALPVISFTGTSLIPYSYDTPLDQMPGYGAPSDPNAWDYVSDKTFPLFSNVRSGLIDPDTPESAKNRTDINGNVMTLVFSDEFNAKNRTFYEGDDPYWYAFDGWYGATQDLEWYDPDAINTGDGTLQIQMDQFASHGLDYRSGMLNSWNQLCFKGGVFEVSVSLPGPAGVHGLWPGMWTMGNLGRPGYLATTDGVWPYTYNECDTGITPNQSMHDGTSNLPGQKLASCTCSGEEHPTPGTGRGAPEIDIAEVSADWGGLGLGVATQSFQVAPFDIWWYPDYDFMETPQYSYSMVNTYTGGPYQQAVSTTSMLNNDWYDGKEYQTFAFEYNPGGDEDAYIQWYIGGVEMMRFDARAIGPNGNIGQRLVSEEPMSMILNLGISHAWVDIVFAELFFPTTMRFDYVRWYQIEGQEIVTCDPPGYETTEYIANHPAAYNNQNFTKWDDAGYDWPTNILMNGCSA